MHAEELVSRDDKAAAKRYRFRRSSFDATPGSQPDKSAADRLHDQDAAPLERYLDRLALNKSRKLHRE